MNKQRRAALDIIYNKLADIRDELDEIRDEEECYWDNMPENLQNSVRYEKADEAVYNMEYAISSLEEAIDYIESTKEKRW